MAKLKTKTAEFEKYFSDMNKVEFEHFITERFDNLDQKIENDRWVEFDNGVKHKMLLKDKVMDMHVDIRAIQSNIVAIQSDIVEIKASNVSVQSDTLILRELSSLHRLMTKYKLYYVVLFLISGSVAREIFLMLSGK